MIRMSLYPHHVCSLSMGTEGSQRLAMASQVDRIGDLLVHRETLFQKIIWKEIENN